MKIIYSSKFAKEYRKLSDEIKDVAEKKEIIFRKNPFDPRLKTHKLKGILKDFYSFSVLYKYRIIFEFSENKKVIYFHGIGNHDIYE